MKHTSIKSAFLLYSLAILIQINPRLGDYLPKNRIINCLETDHQESLEASLVCNRPYNFLNINSVIELELISGISNTTAPQLYELATKLKQSQHLNSINLEEEFLKISGIGAVKAGQLSKIFQLPVEEKTIPA